MDRGAMREMQRIENLRTAGELAAAELAHARKVHEVFGELIEELAPRPTLGAPLTAVSDIEARIELIDDELRATRFDLAGLRGTSATRDASELLRREEAVRTLEAIRAGLAELRDQLKANA